MSDEISAVSPIAIDRTNPDHPRRDQPQHGSRRHPPRPSIPLPEPRVMTPDEDRPVVGSHLDVRV
jgi:hypothetical protein